MHGLDRADALAFYGRWYAPNNAVLVIAGDTTLAEVKTLAERSFGTIPARAVPDRQRLKEPTSYAARRLVLRDSSLHQASWHRLYLTQAYREPPIERPYALEVLAEILAGGSTSRLYRHLVVEQRLADGIGVGYDGNDLDYGRFSFAATPPAGQAPEKIEAAIDEEIAELLKNGIGDEELAAAKGRLAADAIKARDGLGGPAETIGIALATGQSLADVEAWPARIAAISAGQVLEAARSVLRPENSVTGVLLPTEPKS
jgi:zinc protease